jgi:uncharacterized membrane protein YidH (DUF202 family)
MTAPGRDAGAAAERTTLAWRRTGLTLLAVTVTIGRLGLEVLPAAVVIGPTLMFAGLVGWVVARARRSRHPVTTGDGVAFLVLADGRPPALVAVVIAGSAVGELTAVLARAAT